MKSFSSFGPRRRIFIFLAAACLAFGPSGCSLKKIQKQAESVENAGFIQGKVRVESPQKGPVVVVLYREENGIPIKESQVVASDRGDYSFVSAPEEPCYIASFIDLNKDDRYQAGEHGSYYGNPSVVQVASRQVLSLDPIVITGKPPKVDTGIKEVDNTAAIWRNIGTVVGLNDPRFVRDNYEMGLWEPFDFLEHAEGGLFFLQEYQEDKVPVLFVHGVMGGPTDWEKVVDSMDREKFQPWLLFYPSGFRLEMISEYLVQAVVRLQNTHGFENFYVVAHSMGGLVARSFVKKYVRHSRGNADRLGMVMTINSPMAGMAAAASGVKYSPIVVPSWRDVEPGSQFLKDIHTWTWPGQIPYHLVISYVDGKSGDGVVSLQSQSRLKLQSESGRIYLFNNDHVGTLNAPDFHGVFNKILHGHGLEGKLEN